ncbi:unnamed protein product [Paramecium pentaurelia]|uniref:Uncharacterized protein n=1 Tax=Paramecium pentaurelia TaxID=43138 RepID=A0A8S1YGA2_9CILI|nr:unnamed protein product [Paramecium pentaurelia]
MNNNNSFSKSGILLLELNKQKYKTYQIYINNLNIRDNQCGQVGYSFFNEFKRILTSNQEQILGQIKHDIIINNYKYLGNQAEFGTCLFLINLMQLQFFKVMKHIKLEGQFILQDQNPNYSQQIVIQSIIMHKLLVQSILIIVQVKIQKDLIQILLKLVHISLEMLVQVPTNLSITLNNYKSILNTYPIYEINDCLYEQLKILNMKIEEYFCQVKLQSKNIKNLIQNLSNYNHQTQLLELLHQII